MPLDIVIGAQWGDEGKGRVVDLLSANSDLVARVNGGDNAGHTVTVGDEIYKLHLIPSGIIHPNTTGVMSAGMVINPFTLVDEIAMLREAGVAITPERLWISDAAHLITPAHRLLDRTKDTALGKAQIGTTGRGIGPAYTDKAERCGLRAGEILDADYFAERVRAHFEEASRQLVQWYGQPAIDIDDMVREFLEKSGELRPFIRRIGPLVKATLDSDKVVLVEGAQGTLLDIEQGTYPYVTSSVTTAGGVPGALGIGLQPARRIIGVVKAFQTRVGAGPFPTELEGNSAGHLRGTGKNPWDEFGTTTGRPRRVGWLDLVLLRYAHEVNGFTELFMTKLDVLSGLDEIKICTSYLRDGHNVETLDFSGDARLLEECEPIYETLPGWDADLRGSRTWDDLPKGARNYIQFIEQHSKLEVKLISVGPERTNLVSREKTMPDFESYQSPFTWRYGSSEMRVIWSEVNKRRIWRRIWVTMAEAQIPFDLVTRGQADDLAEHEKEIDVERALEIENEIHHDLMAEIRIFAGQSPIGGPILHLGATSMDIKDNAEVLQIRDSLDLVLSKLVNLLNAFEKKISEYADLPVMAFTHLQPAEPTTLGYRLASYAQDFLNDQEDLFRIRQNLRGKGFKGAVGTAAASVILMGQEGQTKFENEMSRVLDLPFFLISTQTYSRRQDYMLLSALAGLAASAHKFAFDLRLLQSEVIAELAEPFGSQQVGSSAMPFKRNPVEAEKIDSLARLVSTAPLTAWGNHANSLLERTLDDSANRRLVFPQTFLAVDEILNAMIRIVEGLVVNPSSIERNLEKFGPFSALERVLVEAVKRGADRQAMHEALRQVSMLAWEVVQQGEPNPLIGMINQDERISVWIPVEEIARLFEIGSYTGNAKERALFLASQIRDRFSKINHHT